jgi:type VI secretion system protein ImpM
MSDFRTVKPADTLPPSGIPAVPGWFGKIPALGDFASRRLPASFVRLWDEWLSAELSESAAELGTAWSESYRAGPILCFYAGSGVIDEHPWHGTVTPSYDRVGREYPLTLAAPGVPQIGPETGWGPWVAVAQRALTPGCGPDGLDEALASLHYDITGQHDAADLRRERECATLCTGASSWWCWSTENSAAAELGIFERLPQGLYLRVLIEQQQRR